MTARLLAPVLLLAVSALAAAQDAGKPDPKATQVWAPVPPVVTPGATAGAAPSSDPWARQEHTFPKLNEEMIRAVTPYGHEETPAQGAVLFERGQRSVDFFLVLQGNIEVFELDLALNPGVA